MSLTRSGHPKRPSAGIQAMGYPRPDTPDGGLKAWKITLGPQPNYTTTLTTTVSPQPHPLAASIVETRFKSVSPNAPARTTRAYTRSGPRKPAPLLQNFLDRNGNQLYHRNILSTAVKAVQYSGGSSLKQPPDQSSPFIPIIQPLRSTYSENIGTFPTIQCGFLHPGKKTIDGRYAWSDGEQYDVEINDKDQTYR